MFEYIWGILTDSNYVKLYSIIGGVLIIAAEAVFLYFEIRRKKTNPFTPHVFKDSE